MRVLIIGGSGMLGHKLVQSWRGKFELGVTVRGVHDDLTRPEIYRHGKIYEKIDVENIGGVEYVIADFQPAVIVNAAGIIKQQPTAKNVIKTLRVNAVFPHQLAELAENYRARLIGISTDCVFDGRDGDYVETDLSNANDLYGRSKSLGEVVENDCLTLRTSIIGRELGTAHSLVEWFLSNRGKSVRGFVNAIYSGFPTVVFADIIAEVIENHPHLRGLYHVSSEPLNKYELLKLVRAAYRVDIEIEPDADFTIDRSLDSTKFREAVGFVPTEWSEMIARMAADNSLYESSQRLTG